MKRTFILSIIFIIGISVDAQTITTTAGTISSCPGNIQIPIDVINFNDVASISLSLKYDTLLLKYTGLGNVHPQIQNGILIHNAAGGFVKISWFITPPQSVTIGSAKLLDLDFEYFSDDAILQWDTITHGNCQYSNSNLDVIPASFVDGGVFSALTSPSLINPPHQSNSVPVDNKFIWSASPCSPTYRIQISKDSVFYDIVIAATGLNDTTYDVNNLEYNTSYFWRVNASLSQQTSQWSDTGKFITKTAPGIFEYPSNNNKLNLSASPNPFNENTSITFDLPEPGYISILIHDIGGKTIFNQQYNNKYNKGFHKIPLHFSSITSGIYLLEMRSSGDKAILSQRIKIFIIKH